MSMWSLRWHFTNKSVAGAPYSIKCYSYSLSLSHSRTLWWRVRWLEQCRLEVAAELQQWWRRTNRRRKSVPRSSSSHRESSITQRGALCSRYDQRRLWSTPKTPTWTYVRAVVTMLHRMTTSQLPVNAIVPREKYDCHNSAILKCIRGMLAFCRLFHPSYFPLRIFRVCTVIMTWAVITARFIITAREAFHCEHTVSFVYTCRLISTRITRVK